jgi:hypothetical protein
MMAIQLLKLNTGETYRSFTRLRDQEAIIELDDGPALRLAFSTTDEALQQDMTAWLQEIGRTMDVLEPLERATNALMALCGEGKKN